MGGMGEHGGEHGGMGEHGHDGEHGGMGEHGGEHGGMGEHGQYGEHVGMGEHGGEHGGMGEHGGEHGGMGEHSGEHGGMSGHSSEKPHVGEYLGGSHGEWDEHSEHGGHMGEKQGEFEVSSVETRLEEPEEAPKIEIITKEEKSSGLSFGTFVIGSVVGFVVWGPAAVAFVYFKYYRNREVAAPKHYDAVVPGQEVV